MKIVWNSVAPWIPSGYGQQTAQVCRRLRDAGHDVAISAIAGIEGHVGEWEGITVYPTDTTRFNKLALRKYVMRHSADGTGKDVQVIALQDLWTWLDASPVSGGIPADYRGLNLAAWCPVEHDPMPVNTSQVIQAFNVRPIAMSRFGEKKMRESGFMPMYVPHGIDTTALAPRPEARAEIRKALNVNDDQFLIGMVSHNQGISPARKSFPEVFYAFSIFQKRHPEAVLYLHTDVHGLNQGLNLVPLWKWFDIPDSAVRFVDQDRYWLGEIETHHMGFMYNALDVLACPSYGEGFGIPLVEAQACGTPVITTDWTSMTELAGPGWLCDGEPFYNPGSASFWKKPAISEILDAFEQAYTHKNNQELRDKCREFAVQYDADKVFEEHWKPVLDSLSRPREVPPLPALNREQRRSKIKAAKKAAA